MDVRRDRQGYTLIELMVVVAIIGILGAIAIPGYIGYRLRAERSVAWTDLQALRLLEEQFYAENNAYTTGLLSGEVAIRVQLPGFRPDPGSLYTYEVDNNGGDTQTFTATATSNGGRDPGPDWTIDQDNVRNF